MKKNVIVLFGGISSEYNVSLSSAVSIITHFPFDQFNMIKVGINQEGRWLMGNFTGEEIIEDRWMNNAEAEEVSPSTQKNSSLIRESTQKPLHIDTVIHCIHGKYGEDGIIQAQLEMSGMRYVGSGITSSAICYDKEIIHRLIKSEKIRMAEYIVLHQATIDDQKYNQIVNKMGKILVIKPAREGSSYGVNVVHNFNEFILGLKEAWKYDHKILVERYIKGIEIGCSIAKIEGHLIASICDEIELNTEIFDYSGKYSFKNALVHCPARISQEHSILIQKFAKQIFIMLECRDMARIDFFLGYDQNIYLNEINTIPGFTSHSRFPLMMEQSGIEYSQLIKHLINNSLETDYAR